MRVTGLAVLACALVALGLASAAQDGEGSLSEAKPERWLCLVNCQLPSRFCAFPSAALLHRNLGELMC